MSEMVNTIRNECLSVSISSVGAEMMSIKDAEGTEYLWQGDPKYWKDRAINLFPYIGRMTKGIYSLHNDIYHMGIHGFIKSSIMRVEKLTSQQIAFCYRDNQETKNIYPYAFEYRVYYQIENKQIVITYEVKNNDQKEMYFGIGGHPGFNVPLVKELEFSDYFLEFSNINTPRRVGMSKECFVNANNSRFELENGKCLPLSHQLFSNDAIILMEMDRAVTLKTEKNNKAVTVSYPQMNYLGLWHTPNSDAPYICIEPWSSLPSRQGIVEDFERHPNLVRLPIGEIYRNTWSITLY